MKLKTTISMMSMALAACSTINPPVDQSAQNRISNELKDASASSKTAPVPATVNASLLPPLKMQLPKAFGNQLEQRFDLNVDNALLGNVLAGIVSGTPYSILLKPKTEVSTATSKDAAQQPVTATKLPDRVTLRLKNVTLFEALDAIREVYGYDYTLDGNRIYVQPPELQTRLYQVNYIVGQRRGVSDMQVVGGTSSSGSSSGNTAGTGGASGSGGSGGFASIQASALSTMSKSDIWGEAEDALRTVLGCQISKDLAKGGATNTGNTNATTSGGTSSRADVSFVGESHSGDRTRGVDGCVDGRAISVNQMSGTILVRGMPKELRLIESLLRSMQLSIDRQVIIESKIIDVELNSDAQQGINWASFQQGWHRASVGANTNQIDGTRSASAGSINAGTSLGGLLGTQMLNTSTPNAFSAGLGVALQFTNFSALINFLQTQGQVHVLSSPRISTLNNQKAVIKVGSEESFVTNASGGSITAGTGGSPATVANPSITYQPFFSGISLDVTPQIDDNDKITLHVHSLVNSIAVKDKLAIISASGDRSLPFAVNSINETDSVVKARDGQVIVIGGLMTESGTDDRSKIPGAGDVPLAGSLFSRGAQKSTKRELVILLKPTVVKSESTWNNEIAATQERIERLGGNAADTTRK